MDHYSVQKLAGLSGISVRTLHYYDHIGLLKPSVRNEARYRLYGEKELLRLQQILFYKELGIPLKDIGEILDNPGFNLVDALEDHKTSLLAKKDRINQLLVTIDKTIKNLKKGDVMSQPEELYEGLNKEKMLKYRQEAIEKYGKEAVERSENELMKLGKSDFAKLKAESEQNFQALFLLKDEDPTSDLVQREIAHHYELIRKFWGTANSEDKQAEAYAGLGQLYVDDERFTTLEGEPQPKFAQFLKKAMEYFVNNNLKSDFSQNHEIFRNT